MKELKIEGFPFKIRVAWFGNFIRVYLIGEDREYLIEIFHTSAKKVVVSEKRWVKLAGAED